MSYGEVYIQSDLNKGESITKVAGKLHTRYSDIPMKRAKKIVAYIKKYGIDKLNPHWKTPKSEILMQKRKQKAMKEFNLKEVNQ